MFLIFFYVYGFDLLPHKRVPSPFSDSRHEPLPQKPLPNPGPIGDDDIEMVIASTRKDNVTWLNDYLLDWKKNIYVVDDSSAALTVPMNKGREAMVFLT